MAQKIITIKTGTFNLMNLMLPGVEMYGSMKLSQYDFDPKAEWINNMLTQMNADVIGFQECFHLELSSASSARTSCTRARKW